MPYFPPGVTITEATAPQVVPLLTSAAEVALVGYALGRQTRTDQFVLEGEAATKLPFLESLAGSKLVKILSVISALNPQEPAGSKGLGFKGSAVDWEEKTGEGAIKRIGGGNIPNKTLVNVTYEYTPADYYNPIRLFNFNEVENRFGNALENGVINSPLSLAAQKAFENGAGSLILQPLFRTSTGSIEYSPKGFISNAEQPTAAQSLAKVTWETSFKALNTVEVINVLTPVAGQGQRIESKEELSDTNMEEIMLAFLGYQQLRNTEQQYIYGVFGEDATRTGSGLVATIRTHGKNLRSYAGEAQAQQNLLVNTANFSIQLPGSPATISIGGQYMAAAVAGAMAARPSSASLTRKGIIGFNAINDLRTPAEKNKDAEEGLFVVEQIQGNFIRCRHALSLDNTHGAARSEVSVVRAKYLMIESIRKTLENQVIGQIIADANSPVIVRSAIVGVLSALQSAGQLVAFTAPQCQLASLEPTTITASFSYRPAFTLNYINIKFALDLTTNSVTLVEKAGV